MESAIDLFPPAIAPVEAAVRYFAWVPVKNSDWKRVDYAIIDKKLGAPILENR